MPVFKDPRVQLLADCLASNPPPPYQPRRSRSQAVMAWMAPAFAEFEADAHRAFQNGTYRLPEIGGAERERNLSRPAQSWFRRIFRLQ